MASTVGDLTAPSNIWDGLEPLTSSWGGSIPIDWDDPACTSVDHIAPCSVTPSPWNSGHEIPIASLVQHEKTVVFGDYGYAKYAAPACEMGREVSHIKPAISLNNSNPPQYGFGVPFTPIEQFEVSDWKEQMRDTIGDISVEGIQSHEHQRY